MLETTFIIDWRNCSPAAVQTDTINGILWRMASAKTQKARFKDVSGIDLDMVHTINHKRSSIPVGSLPEDRIDLP